MKIVMLAQAVSNAAVANQTAVDNGNKTPFLPGRQVEAFIDVSSDASAAGTIVIQGSDDNSTWTTLLTSTTLAGKRGMVAAYRYMRAGQTVAGTAGTFNAGLRAT